MEPSKEKDYRGTVYMFYEALAMKNIDRIEHLFSSDASVFWGPYKFTGTEKINEWVIGLFELFPFMSFKEKSWTKEGEKAQHEFMIAFLTPQGRKGWLPCEAEYEFESGAIKAIKIKLLHGFLAVNKDEVERVKPQTSKA